MRERDESGITGGRQDPLGYELLQHLRREVGHGFLRKEVGAGQPVSTRG